MRFTTFLLSAALVIGCNAKDPSSVEQGSAHQDGDGAGNAHTHGTGHRESDEGANAHAHGGSQHEDHAAERRKLQVHSEEVEAGVETTIRMSIPSEVGEVVKDFKESHEAKIHLVIVRDGLDQFAHLHPAVNAESGEVTVQHTFQLGGTYLVFAEFQTKDGTPSLAEGQVSVAGDSPAAPALEPNVPGSVTADGLTAEITVDGAKAGEEGTISFALSTTDGTPVSDLEPYMGAMGHLNAISGDATQYVHSHPSDQAGEKNRVTFVAHFQKAGLYKGWGQFKRNGKVQIVPFTLMVE